MFCGFSARIAGSGTSFAHRGDFPVRLLAVFDDMEVRNRRRGTNVVPPVKPGSQARFPGRLYFCKPPFVSRSKDGYNRHQALASHHPARGSLINRRD